MRTAVFKKWLEIDSKRFQNQLFLQMLAVEKVVRCEKYLDVPDRDGNKPFVFTIDGKDLQASNRKGANWNLILVRTKKCFKGDLTQQFAVFKKWIESSRLK